jgi:phosphoribosyl 1,2-cyclic phosphodiesterase
MLRVTVLGSGSSGNCSVVESASTRLLVDAGFSARQIVARLDRAGIDPASLSGILVTHEHIDHVQGLEVFSRRFRLPVYANRGTADAVGFAPEPGWRIVATGATFALGDIEVTSFSIPHDAADPVGYTLAADGATLAFATDLGYATRLVQERLRPAHTILLESNHDERMLQDDARRPWHTKQRILSRHGHLSNQAAAKVVAELLGGNLRRVVLGHLSRDCNRPDLALSTLRAHLGEPCPVELHCADQSEISPTFEVAPPLTAGAI